MAERMTDKLLRLLDNSPLKDEAMRARQAESILREALQRIENESKPEHWTTKEVLAGFVRMLAAEAILKTLDEE